MNVGDQPLPELRYDGPMADWLQFTELDPTSASFTASFYLRIDGYSLAALACKRRQKASEFMGLPQGGIVS